ncbi:MAG: pilus assembly protein PilP [Halomonas subglaciescola]|nr:pilus assembly protein PilP [Halomonas subglaciescola]
MPRLTVVFFLTVLVAGCADPALDTLKVALDDMRHFSDAPPQVSVPKMPDYKTVIYTQGEQRSPFLPPSDDVSAEAIHTFSSELAPDQARKPEPLESYPLQELELVGTMRMGARHNALIKNPQGEVVPVQQGSYMGVDYGRVKAVDAHEVVVVERIFTPQEGWQERDVSMALSTDDTKR